MRDIPPSWAIALGVAALMTVIVWLGMNRFGTVSWLASRVAYLLGGGLIGFLALSFWPAWPPLAFIGGVLGIGAVRDGREEDLALMLCGFGAAWTLLLGWRILNDLADPAVYGSRGALVWFLIGSAVLVGGLILLIVRVASERDAA